MMHDVWLLSGARFPVAITTGRRFKAAGPTISRQAGGRIVALSIRGTMVKDESPFPTDTTVSTRLLAERINALATDDSVAGILIDLDSPGGEVAGVSTLGEAIHAARQTKPVYINVEDLCASAGVWVASQASKVFASTGTSMLGSIGVISLLVDESEAVRNSGVKVVEVKSNPFKSSGLAGIPDELVANVQSIVNDVHAEFETAIRVGRRLPQSRIEKIATGEIFLAEPARLLGLVDGIQSREKTLKQLAEAAGIDPESVGVKADQREFLARERDRDQLLKHMGAFF